MKRLNERETKTLAEMSDIWVMCPECDGSGRKEGYGVQCSCCIGEGKINRVRIAELYVYWTLRARDGKNSVDESDVRIQMHQKCELEIFRTAIGWWEL